MIRARLNNIVDEYCTEQSIINNTSITDERTKLASRLYTGSTTNIEANKWLHKVLNDDSELFTGTIRVINKIVNLVD